MALFINDTKRRVLEYVPGFENNGSASWRSINGDFFEASKNQVEDALSFFHARDFEEIAPYMAVLDIINDILDVTLDHGVITPNGEYFGLRKNASVDDFVEALSAIKDKLPEVLRKQVDCYGIGTPWLEVRKDSGSIPIPFGSSEAQIRALDTIGYKNGDQIDYSGKFYNEAFPLEDVRGYPVPNNPALKDLVDICFDLWDEWDRFRVENKAACASIQVIGIENGYSVY